MTTGPYGDAGPPQYPTSGPYPAPPYPGPAGGFPTGYPPNPYAAHPYLPGMYYVPPRNGLGVAALVLGICSCALFFWPWFCWPSGVLAIVFGAVGLSRAGRGEATNRGQAKAGLILGIVGLLIDFVIVIVLIGLIAGAADTVVTSVPS